MRRIVEDEAPDDPDEMYGADEDEEEEATRTRRRTRTTRAVRWRGWARGRRRRDR